MRSSALIAKEVRKEVVRSLRRITRAIDLYSKRLVQQCSLTGPQVVIMQEIAQADQITIGELARCVSLSPATVTGILNRLAQRRLVERTQDHHDRRRKVVRLTEQGEQLLSSAPSLLQDQFLEAFEQLATWEQSQILAVLQRVAGLMDAEQLDAAPMLTSGRIDTPESEVAKRA